MDKVKNVLNYMVGQNMNLIEITDLRNRLTSMITAEEMKHFWRNTQ